MGSNRHIFFKIAIMLACLIFHSATLWSQQEPGEWDKAGKEISEAAKAVGSATEEGWRKTREKTAEMVQGTKAKSTEVWDKTKQESSEVVEKTVEVSEDIAAEAAQQSKGFWQKTRTTVNKWYDQAKARVHELTAPDQQ